MSYTSVIMHRLLYMLFTLRLLMVQYELLRRICYEPPQRGTFCGMDGPVWRGLVSGITVLVAASSIPPLPAAIRRAVMGKCPNCGKGALYKSYLKQVDHCSVCGESYGQIHADDGPPWLTILLVGHVIVPLIFIVTSVITWPLWVTMSVWPAATALLALAVLPRAKGVFLAIIWTTQSPGFEKS
jgi:uncharacterized protein (DUF983 family)